MNETDISNLTNTATEIIKKDEPLPYLYAFKSNIKGQIPQIAHLWVKVVIYVLQNQFPFW